MNLGRYEIVRELGKGAMGVVYLAHDPVIGRLVALKTIHQVGDSTEDEKEFRERFRREAQSAGRLSHRSIVTIYDIVEDEESGLAFISMEFVEGRNLRDILTSDGRFPHAEIAMLIAEIADALDYAHARGIVHRDVKPANIVLMPDGSAKITDFGIAKILAGGSLTAPGQFLGTPNYMAPEQIKATARVDGRADIFALGVVLYEALTGKKPFTGDSLTDVSYRIVHAPFVPLGEIDPHIPDAYDAIVNRCLEKDPERRYQRAAELAADLRAAASSEPTRTTVPAQPIPDDPARTIAVGRVPQDLIVTRDDRSPDEIAGSSDPDDADYATIATTGSVVGQSRRWPWLPIIAMGALFAVVVIATMIWKSTGASRPTLTERDVSIARQAELQREASALYRKGDFEGAYETYKDLAKLAPQSPEVARMVAKLEEMRARPNPGGPTAPATATRPETTTTTPPPHTSERRPRPKETSVREHPATRSRPAPLPSPAVLLTQFEPGVNDGKIEVFADGQIILSQPLWETHWLRKTPKPVSEYRQIPAETSKVTVVVIIPSLEIRTSRTVKPKLHAGKLTRLVVSLNQTAKTISVNLS